MCFGAQQNGSVTECTNRSVDSAANGEDRLRIKPVAFSIGVSEYNCQATDLSNDSFICVNNYLIWNDFFGLCLH